MTGSFTSDFNIICYYFMYQNSSLMKTKITVAAVVLLAFATIAAKPVPETKEITSSKANVITKATFNGFAFFRTHRQGKDGITSTWGMSTESGITGYIIQRTYLDPSDPYGWEDVCAMPCNSSRSYKWTDENVYPGYISYRIIAVSSGSPDIVSDINTIHIVGH
jgi:hypothetical protein